MAKTKSHGPFLTQNKIYGMTTHVNHATSQTTDPGLRRLVEFAHMTLRPVEAVQTSQKFIKMQDSLKNIVRKYYPNEEPVATFLRASLPSNKNVLTEKKERLLSVLRDFRELIEKDKNLKRLLEVDFQNAARGFLRWADEGDDRDNNNANPGSSNTRRPTVENASVTRLSKVARELLTSNKLSADLQSVQNKMTEHIDEYFSSVNPPEDRRGRFLAVLKEEKPPTNLKQKREYYQILQLFDDLVHEKGLQRYITNDNLSLAGPSTQTVPIPVGEMIGPMPHVPIDKIPMYNSMTLPIIKTLMPDSSAYSFQRSVANRTGILTEYEKAFRTRYEMLKKTASALIGGTPSAEDVRIGECTATALTTSQRVQSALGINGSQLRAGGRYVVRMTIYYPEPIALGFDTHEVGDVIPKSRSGTYFERLSSRNIRFMVQEDLMRMAHKGLYRFSPPRTEKNGKSRGGQFRLVTESSTAQNAVEGYAVYVTVYHVPNGADFVDDGIAPTVDQYSEWFNRNIVPICGTFVKTRRPGGGSVIVIPTEAIFTHDYSKKSFKGSLVQSMQKHVNATLLTQKRLSLGKGLVKMEARGKGTHKNLKYRLSGSLLELITTDGMKKKQNGRPVTSQTTVKDKLQEYVKSVMKEYKDKTSDKYQRIPNSAPVHLAKSLYSDSKTLHAIVRNHAVENNATKNRRNYDINTIADVTLLWLKIITDLCGGGVYFLNNASNENDMYALDIVLSNDNTEVVVSWRKDSRRFPNEFWKAASSNGHPR